MPFINLPEDRPIVLWLPNPHNASDLFECLSQIGSSLGISLIVIKEDSIESAPDFRGLVIKHIEQISKLKPDAKKNIYPAQSTVILLIHRPSTKAELKSLVESETDRFPILDGVIEFKYSIQSDEDEGTPKVSLPNAPAKHVEEISKISAEGEMVERTDQNNGGDGVQGKL